MKKRTDKMMRQEEFLNNLNFILKCKVTSLFEA